MRAVAVEELLQPLDAVGACISVGFKPVQNAARVFEPGRIVQVKQRVGAVGNRGFFDMARGGRGVFDFAEPAVAQQGAQERGFAGIGVPDDGEGKGLVVHHILREWIFRRPFSGWRLNRAFQVRLLVFQTTFLRRFVRFQPCHVALCQRVAPVVQCFGQVV